MYLSEYLIRLVITKKWYAYYKLDSINGKLSMLLFVKKKNIVIKSKGRKGVICETTRVK